MLKDGQHHQRDISKYLVWSGKKVAFAALKSKLSQLSIYYITRSLLILFFGALLAHSTRKDISNIGWTMYVLKLDY